MADVEIFLRTEGKPEVFGVELGVAACVRELISAAADKGIIESSSPEWLVFLEDEDEPVAPDASLEKCRDHRHVHLHRCRRIAVTVRFNGREIENQFPPSATIARVKAAFVGPKGFDLPRVDAAEHALQVCGSADRPEPDQHIGTLTNRCCSVCFDLVPKERIEGGI